MSPLITLDFIQTVAFAGVILFFGYGIRSGWCRRWRASTFPRRCAAVFPSPAIFAVLHAFGRQPLAFDTALQVPLQNAFFASIGFAASLSLLRRGGPLVIGFFAIAAWSRCCRTLLAEPLPGRSGNTRSWASLPAPSP